MIIFQGSVKLPQTGIHTCKRKFFCLRFCLDFLPSAGCTGSKPPSCSPLSCGIACLPGICYNAVKAEPDHQPRKCVQIGANMEKKDKRYQAYLRILKEELVPAMGCTEPIALAYCAAKAREILAACRTACWWKQAVI